MATAWIRTPSILPGSNKTTGIAIMPLTEPHAVSSFRTGALARLHGTLAAMVPMLPAGKLMPPRLPARCLARDAVVARALQAHEPLVLMRAAAGYGKSTVLAQCRAALLAQGWQVPWLVLDRGDDDVPRLLQSLAGALAPVLGPTPAQLPALLEAVAGSGRHAGRWVLVIDELEHVPAAPAQAVLHDLLRVLPRGARVLAGSRHALALPALQIGEAELRLSDAEAQALLHLHDVRGVGPQSVAHLVRRTEGWPVALAALAQAAAGTEWHDDRLAGLVQGAGVDAFLAEEVFERLRPELRDFLLRTCVLQTLEPAACQALLAQGDAAALLAELSSLGSFVTPLQGQQPAWRCHRLLADMLRERLQRDDSGLAERLHLRAAAWFEQQQRMAPAIEHALAAGDGPLAAELLLRAAESFLEQGRFRLLLRWCSLLPPAVLAAQPMLQMTQAWATVLARGAIAGREVVQAHGLERCLQARVQAHLRVLQAFLLALEDRFDLAAAAGEAALDQHGGSSRFLHGMLCSVLAQVNLVLGRDPMPFLAMADARSPFQLAQMYRSAVLGLLEARSGQLRKGTARLRISIENGYRPGAPVSPYIGIYNAYTRYEANDLADAERELAMHAAQARDAGLADHVIACAVMRSRIAQRAGDSVAAHELLCELEHDGQQRRLPRVVAAACLERSRLLLLQGRVPMADDALQRALEVYDWQLAAGLELPAQDSEGPVFGRLRLDLALGRHEAALALALAELTRATAARSRRRAIKLQVLAALAEWQGGRREAACARLRPVMVTCSHEGFFRHVADEGPTLAPLLLQLLLDNRHGPRPARDPILQEHLQRLLVELGAPVPEALPDADTAAPLTGREVDVLRHIAAGCSNQVISERMGIGDSTVRTHLRSINRKLGAASRAQAVAIARRQMILR